MPTADAAGGAPLSTGSGRVIDDLERRLAAFDSATQRLSRTIDTVETKAGESSRASSAKRHAVLAAPTPISGDEISALRPAVSAASPPTGALTARRRSEGGAPTPGFTSAHGKPAIPAIPAAAPAPAPAAAAAPPAAGPAKTRSGRRSLVIAGIAIGAAVLGALALVRAFREIPEAYVWAATSTMNAPAAGTVAGIAAQVGATVATGSTLLRIAGPAGDAATVSAPAERIVTRLLVANGTRVAAREPLCTLADPATLRVVVPLPGPSSLAVGDRVRIRLLGEDRRLYGTVESVRLRGEPTPLAEPPQQPAHALILVDPGPIRPALGQGAMILPLGDDGNGRRALLWLRELLP